ncbi:MAG: ligase [Paenibacillus sp.]|jgi:bifunctional non-homologous end joining protein LigD|nr:ligase [Paenibacillus sp.]
MEPIIPFEPIRGDNIPADGNWIYQIKWDGVRILTYFDGTDCRLYNRRINERTYHYPEIYNVSAYSNAQSFILDGEVIALAADGQPSFNEVMRRDGLRRMERVQHVMQEVPVYYMVFDILFLNGNWINQQPLDHRMNILRNIITPNENVQIVTSHSSGNQLFQLMREKGMEGIVCKKLDSTYAAGGKDNRWIKVKNYGDVIAAIGGFTLSGGIINSVLLGLYDSEGRFWYIGHTGTGKLSKADWRGLTERLKPHVQKDRPFVNKPERHNDAVWVRPEVAVKVTYTEWRLHEGRSLRQPSLKSFVDHPAKECVFPDNR